MKKSLIACLMIAIVFGWSAGPVTRADPPTETAVSLVFHVEPNNPDSGVSMIVNLTLSPVDSDGNAVGWSINQAVFSRPTDADGMKSWGTNDVAILNSSDGLWWVTHDNADVPVETEFTKLPMLIGMGAAENAEDADLVFFIDGTNASDQPPSNTPYNEHTALGSYYFSDGQLIVMDDDDEPIEVDRPHDPEAH